MVKHAYSWWNRTDDETEYIDDQLLGAFVDGEIDAVNREAIIQAMETSPEVRDRVYRFRRAKDLMQPGFGDARPSSGQESNPASQSWNRLSTRIAASVAALAISFRASILAGWT